MGRVIVCELDHRWHRPGGQHRGLLLLRLYFYEGDRRRKPYNGIAAEKSVAIAALAAFFEKPHRNGLRFRLRLTLPPSVIEPELRPEDFEPCARWIVTPEQAREIEAQRARPSQPEGGADGDTN